MKTTLATLAVAFATLCPLARAAHAYTMPDGFTPPTGFVVDEKLSRTFDFSHVPIAYPRKGSGGTERIDPEGKTWLIFLRVTPPNRTSDATDAAMRAALKAQGWDLHTSSGLVIAHRTSGGQEQWFSGSAASGDFRASIVALGPAPHSLKLPAPTATPETIGDGDDFPYLQKFPGSTLKKTVALPGESFDASPPGAKEHRVGPPLVKKIYDLPASVSTYEFMVVYRDALTRAGWTVIRTAASSDTLVVAHYAKNGRDLFCYLHGDTYSVADVGVTNEAKRLADTLAREGHVAIYGIYFDVDKSTLRPESETALQHILELLEADANLKLEVQGHTDNTGPAAHNRTLSDDRAASVKKWLVDHGVAEARLTTKGFGDSQPVADNKTAEGRAKNRRVELQK